MKNSFLTATRLRWVLLAVLLLTLGASIAGFYFFHKTLSGYTAETAEKNASIESTDATIAQIEEGKKYITEHETSQKRAETIVAESQFYRYQDQIIDNIQKLAKSSKLKVDKIQFVKPGEQAASGSTAPSSGSASAATGGTAAAGAATASDSIPGFEIAKAEITFSPQGSGDPYYQYILDFMYKLEHNSLRMHTSVIELSAKSINSKKVTISTLSIGVYLKQGGGS